MTIPGKFGSIDQVFPHKKMSEFPVKSYVKLSVVVDAEFTINITFVNVMEDHYGTFLQKLQIKRNKRYIYFD